MSEKMACNKQPYNTNCVPKPNYQKKPYNKSPEANKNRTEDRTPICFKCNKPGNVARYCIVRYVRIVKEDPIVKQDKVEEEIQIDKGINKSRPLLYADKLLRRLSYIEKEDNPVTESEMKSQEDTSVKFDGDCSLEKCIKGGRKKEYTKSVLEERHKARLEEQKRKLIKEGGRRFQRINDRIEKKLIMEIDNYITENFKEAMNSGGRNEWLKAMEEELS
ncbi:hypothetical protein LAZ67_X003874 [Cordylochernes scorpioides]|uniref:CCHC-type domain-containing protein n=1 Tax=Cordylochernes scorpioides TaxID=51811 RepID=A0ABY6LUR7_9ARAC|nr:hypothetical protein LAZ67_X003874 [Cordylochernes scorpioides]